MIFRRDASDEWLEMQKLTRTSAEIIDANFGTSVEIWKSRTVAVAAEGEEAVYCFEYSNVESAWVQTARLTSPSSQGTVHFGASLALGDTVLAIGAPAEQVTGKARAGAVHIFNRNATDGSYLHSETLHPVQIAAENRFGFGMALRDPGLLVVSAPFADRSPDSVNTGTAHVFTWSPSSSSWEHSETIARPGSLPHDYFGADLALGAHLMVAGATGDVTHDGTAHVYLLQNWTEEILLNASSVDHPLRINSTHHAFGSAVAISSRFIVVGARLADHNIENQGLAFVYAIVPETVQLNGVTVDNRSAVLNFTLPSPNAAPLVEYVATAEIAGNAGSKVVAIVPAEDVTQGLLRMGNLTNGVSYNFSLAARSKYGEGLRGNEVGPLTPATIPDAPVLQQYRESDGALSVDISLPSWDGGAPIVELTVEIKQSGSGELQVANKTRTNPPDSIQTFTFSGLSNGVHYDISAAVRNWQGISAELLKENLLPATIPGVPVIKRVSGGNANVTIYYAPPANNGGAQIVEYAVYESGGNYTGNYTPHASRTLTVTGLENGQPYDFRLAAINKAGRSPHP